MKERLGTFIVCAIVGAIVWFALGDGPSDTTWPERFRCGAQHSGEYSLLEWVEMSRAGESPCQRQP